MRWPWHSPAVSNAGRVGIENKLELLEQHVRSGQRRETTSADNI